MKTTSSSILRTLLISVAVGFALFTTVTFGHHSFAMYDMTKSVTFTGVLT